MGLALYSPISTYASQTEQEILKRLGRLAWKTVNTVVTLTDQQRMKSDPPFGDAMQRLHVRECTYEDINLFNSRLVCSMSNRDGMDLSLRENMNTAAIVATNAVRELLNMTKATASCIGQEEHLVVCAANDKLRQPTCEFSHELRKYLLELDVSALGSSGCLPGYIPLYVRMPVILRSRNISTDIGIANGSQGVVHRLYTAICTNGFTYCTYALVHFPTSCVELPGLPKGVFPITPISWTFTTLLPDLTHLGARVRATREQLPIQPAFAVTGHSAQGKTLPKVIVNLHEGGFAALCTQNRQGLCITQSVTIDQLNKPLPNDLVQEIHRLNALEHNTYMHLDLLDGKPMDVIDPELE